jgi:hypothetical protein
MSIVTIRNVEDTYQIALKEEEKLVRKQGQRGRGRNQRGGKVVAQDKVRKPKDEEKKPHNHLERGGSSQERQYVNRNIFLQTRGRGRGRGVEIKCFVCEKIRHKYFECIDRKRDGG